MRLRTVLLLSAALVTLPAAAQTEVTLTAARDNTLYEDAAGSLSNGAGQFLFAGVTSRGELRRALVYFDVAGTLPAGATVDAATLSLTVSKSTVAGTETVRVHRVLADWGEGTSDAGNEEGGGTAATTGDATWQHAFFDTQPWTTAGGDAAPDASATQALGGPGRYSWASADLTADVQAWLDDPAANDGWMLRGNEAGTGTAKRFDAREAASPAVRPTLTVVYTLSGTAVDADALPQAVRLEANYPNPFNPRTVITYTLAAAGPVTLRVFDVLGREVATLVDAVEPAGRREVAFDAAGLPGGVYLYRLTAGGTVQTRGMTLLR